MRSELDAIQKHELTALAAALKPGLTVRIERVRPFWCSGFIEDYPLRRGDNVSALYAYLLEEHGGQLYSLTVLGNGGTMYYTAEVSIASKPRDRGVPITRADWEGLPARQTGSADSARARREPAPTDGGIATFVQMFIEAQRESNKATLESVRTIAEAARSQSEKITQSILQSRTEHERPTFAQQLGEVVETSRTLDRVRRAFSSSADGARRSGKPETETDMLMREATRAFISNVAGSMFQRRPPQAPPRAPVPNGRNVRAELPEALSTRQKN